MSGLMRHTTGACFALLVLWAQGTLAQAAKPEPTAAADPPGSLHAVLGKASPQFRRLLDSIKLAPALVPNKTVGTFFVPNDAALNAFLKDMGYTAADLAAKPNLVDLIVSYHFIPGYQVTASDVAEGPKRAASGDDNYIVTLDKNSAGNLTVKDVQGNTATVLSGPVKVGKVSVYTIDKVLRSGNYFNDTLAALQFYPSWVTTNGLAAKSGVDKVLAANKDPYTLFVPNVKAWKPVEPTIKAASQEEIADILKYHVVPGALQVPQDFKDGSLATLLPGQSLKVKVNASATGKDRFKGGAEVVEPLVELTPAVGQPAKVVTYNIYAGKNMVHAVDRVLQPDVAANASASTTAAPKAPAKVTTETASKTPPVAAAAAKQTAAVTKTAAAANQTAAVLKTAAAANHTAAVPKTAAATNQPAAVPKTAAAANQTAAASKTAAATNHTAAVLKTVAAANQTAAASKTAAAAANQTAAASKTAAAASQTAAASKTAAAANHTAAVPKTAAANQTAAVPKTAAAAAANRTAAVLKAARAGKRSAAVPKTAAAAANQTAAASKTAAATNHTAAVLKTAAAANQTAAASKTAAAANQTAAVPKTAAAANQTAAASKTAAAANQTAAVPKTAAAAANRTAAVPKAARAGKRSAAVPETAPAANQTAAVHKTAAAAANHTAVVPKAAAAANQTAAGHKTARAGNQTAAAVKAAAAAGTVSAPKKKAAAAGNATTPKKKAAAAAKPKAQRAATQQVPTNGTMAATAGADSADTAATPSAMPTAAPNTTAAGRRLLAWQPTRLLQQAEGVTEAAGEAVQEMKPPEGITTGKPVEIGALQTSPTGFNMTRIQEALNAAATGEVPVQYTSRFGALPVSTAANGCLNCLAWTKP